MSFSLGLLILGFSFFFLDQKPDSQKLTSYECGFVPYDNSRRPFLIRYYMFALLQLIQVRFLTSNLPWLISTSAVSDYSFWVLIDFLTELVIGLYFSWLRGALDWE
jgi:NADH-quinone oxidoreductase subunit A